MSNSRVESHSRAELRNKIISAATLLEILLSGLVLIGLLLSMVPLLQWMPGLLFDGNAVEVTAWRSAPFWNVRWTSSSASSLSRCWPSTAPVPASKCCSTPSPATWWWVTSPPWRTC